MMANVVVSTRGNCAGRCIAVRSDGSVEWPEWLTAKMPTACRRHADTKEWPGGGYTWAGGAAAQGNLQWHGLP